MTPGASDPLIHQIAFLAEALESEWDGSLGIAATFLPTGESFFGNADAIFPTASVIKIAVVAELYTQVAEGRLSLDDVVTVTPESRVAGSGILAQLTPGLTLPLQDCATLTIALSDNTASNLCLAAVGGPASVNARMREWGMTETTIHRPIQFALAPEDPPHTATGSPRDMLRLLLLLENGGVCSEAVSSQVRDLLQLCHDDSLLPRYLEINPYADELRAPAPPFVVQHKTGAVTGVRNDAALITRGTKTLAVCVYSKGISDARWTAANAGSEAIARVGQVLCRHFFAE